MKLLYLIFTFAVVVFAQRNSFALPPMDWATTTLVEVPFVFRVATERDLLAYVDLTAGSAVVALRRRNNEGAYIHVANFTQSTPTSNLITNGKWVGMMTDFATLFSINEKNELSNASYINLLPEESVDNGFLLADDSFVGSFTLEGSNYTVRTFTYDATTANWTEVAEAALEVPFPLSSLLGVTSCRVYDNHMVIIDTSAAPEEYSVRIYERQQDLSWRFIETVPVNNTRPGLLNIHYNGRDTLIYSIMTQSIDSAGIVFIYTKINGQWVEQTFTLESVGYRPLGYLGLSVAFPNTDSILITAGMEGVTDEDDLSGGKVLYVARNADGKWEPALDLVGQNIFGFGVDVNDFDIVIPSLTFIDGPSNIVRLSFHTAPRCFTDPIDATCNDQQVNDCSDVPIDELYTINNPQCGAVSAIVNGFSLVNNQALSTQLTFTRGYGQDLSCSSTVTCPAPPAAKNVSSGDMLRMGVLSVLACFIFV